MSHFARFLLIATFAASLNGCGGYGTVGNGKSVTEPRTLTAFKKLEIAGGAHVTFTVGARAATVTADSNLINLVDIHVRDETLVVRLTRPVADSSSIKIAISNDVLEGLGLSGGSGFVGSATATANFDIAVSGGSSVELSKLSSTTVVANVSGGSDLTLINGSATKFSISASGGSTVASHGFAVEAGVVTVSGGSTLCVMCTRSITGSASGGSIITLSGSPQTRTVDSSGGSRLIAEN